MASAVKFSRVCRLFQRTAFIAHSKNTVIRPDSRQFHTLLVTENISCWRWKQYGNKRFLQRLSSDQINSLSNTREFEFVKADVVSGNILNKSQFQKLLTLLETGEEAVRWPPSQNDLVDGTFYWRSHSIKALKYDAINTSEAEILLRSTGKLNGCIVASERAKYTRLVWDKLQKLGSNRLKKSVNLYNIYLKMLLENKVAVIPSDVLKDMAARQLRPNQVSYHLLIAAACEKCDMVTAGKLRSEMKKLEMEASIDLYNSFIRGYCKAGDTDKAMEMFVTIRSHKIEPKGETFANLLLGYAGHADIANMKRVLRLADKAGVEVDKWKSLESVKILADAGKKNLAEEVLSMLLDGEPLPSSPYLMSLVMSLIDSRHTDLAVLLFFKVTKDKPDHNQLRDFYRVAVGRNMEVNMLLKFVRMFKKLGYEEATLKAAIQEAYAQKETEYALKLYKYLEKEPDELADAHCLIPAIQVAADEKNHKGLLKLIHLAADMDLWKFRYFIKKAYPLLRKMTMSSEEAVKILKVANPVDVEEWNASMMYALLTNSESLSEAEREVEHMEKLKSPLGSYTLMESLASHLKKPDDWKRVYEFALKLRDRSDWYLDYFPLLEQTCNVFSKAQISLDPVVDFMIKNDIKIRRVYKRFNWLFPNTALSTEKIEQFYDFKRRPSYPPTRVFLREDGDGEVTQSVLQEQLQKVPNHFEEIRHFLMAKAVTEKNKRDIQALLRLNSFAEDWNLVSETRKSLIYLCCWNLSDVDAAFKHYQCLQKQTTHGNSMREDTTAVLASGLCRNGRFQDALYVIQNPKRKAWRQHMSERAIKILLAAAENEEQRQLLDVALTSNYYKSSSDKLDDSLSEEALKNLERQHHFSLFRQLIQAENREELNRVTDTLCKYTLRDEVLHQLAAAYVSEHKIVWARKTIQVSSSIAKILRSELPPRRAKASGPFKLDEVMQICKSIYPLPHSKPMLKSLYSLIKEQTHKGNAKTEQLCLNEVIFHIISKVANTESPDKAAEYIEKLAVSGVTVPSHIKTYLKKWFTVPKRPVPSILKDTQPKSAKQKTDTQRTKMKGVSNLPDPATVADNVEKEDEIKDIVEQIKEVKDVACLPDPVTVADIVGKEEEIKDIIEQITEVKDVASLSDPLTVDDIVEKMEEIKDVVEQIKEVKDVASLSDLATVADIVEKEEEIKDVVEQIKKVKDVSNLSDPVTVADIVEKKEEIKDVAEQSDSATEIIEQLEPVNETVELSETVQDKTEKPEHAKESL